MNRDTRLLVFGGGPLPREGLKLFIDWTRETHPARILLVGWASQQVEATITHLTRELLQFGPITIDVSARPPTTASERSEFLERLAHATGVFFSGGDQNRIGRVIDHAEVGDALRARFRLGLPFAGTSAGTAIMSALMFSGDTDPGALDPESVRLRRGLGLCEGVLFDQHFLKRQRQNRLFAAVLGCIELIGIGVDEGTGLAIEGSSLATVVGPEKVMRVGRRAEGKSLDVRIYETGDRFRIFSPDADVSQAAS